MEINPVLIICILIIAASTYLGYRKGLLLTVYSAGAMLIAIALAYFLMPYGTKLLRSTPVYDAVYESINEKVKSFISENEDENKGEQADAIDEMELPGYTKDVLMTNNNSKTYEKMEASGFKDYVDNSVTIMIMNALSILIIFLVIFTIIKLIGMALKVLTRVPVLHGADKAGGTALGFARGMLIIWMVCIFVAMFPTTEWGRYVFNAIEKSSILTFIYNNNFLMAAVQDIGRIIL